jgi:MoaA/NifB/PqqE/SkfB family radical SAM enzyme
VSLDGLDDVHNRSRSSAEEIIDQIRIAINNGISINLIIVMTRYNINHLPDLFKKAEELNISSVSVLPLHTGTYRDDLQNLAPSKEEVKKNLLYIKKEYSSLVKYKDSIDFFIKNYPDNYYKKKCKISRFFFAFDFDHNLQKCVTLRKIGDNRSITKPISCNRCVNCNNLDFQNIISTIRFGLNHIK